MMPHRQSTTELLRAFPKLAAVVLVAVGAGAALGFGLTTRTVGDDTSGSSARAPTATGKSRTRTAKMPAPTPAGREQIRVRVISAVLHPARTQSGIRRRRGRLSVHIRAVNRGARRVVPKRPSLLAARQRIPTNPRADGPGTRLGPIDPQQTADVTLRFETAGAVTTQLRTQNRARILVAGRSWPITVKVGNPVR